MQTCLPGVSPDALARWKTIDHLAAFDGQTAMSAVEAYHRANDLLRVFKDRVNIGVLRVRGIERDLWGRDATDLLWGLIRLRRPNELPVVVGHDIPWMKQLDGFTPLNAAQAEERLKLAAMIYPQCQVELHHVPTARRLYVPPGSKIDCGCTFLREHQVVGNTFNVMFARLTDNHGTVNGA